MAFRVESSDEARRGFLSLPEKIRRQVSQKIEALARDPYPPGCKALKGRHAGKHRIRSGDYRIIYQVRDDVLLVLIVKIGQRGNVYR